MYKMEREQSVSHDIPWRNKKQIEIFDVKKYIQY